jgi:dihydroceramidase
VVVSALRWFKSCTDELCRHLMTGTGAYFYIVWGIWLRHCLNGRQEEYRLVWPRWTSLPSIVRQEKSHAIGHANGRANGHAKDS